MAVATAEKPAKAEKKKVMVTYRPQSGDPSEIKWNGHNFVANVPRPVAHENMIEQAKGNPWFDVEGHEKPKAQPANTPKTPEQYRAYAADWFKKAKTSADFEQRWEEEEEMRDAAGVGTDDVEWLQSIANPRLAELKKSEQ